MELKDTIPMMESPDYKERFKAEYNQIVIRTNKLKSMLERWSKGELNFTPTCSFTLLNAQLCVMEAYRDLLEGRATVEEIDLLKQ